MCNATKVTPFRIVAKNEERGQPEASYVRSVKVFLPHDTEVELMKSRRVLVGNIWQVFLDVMEIGEKTGMGNWTEIMSVFSWLS